MNIQLKFFISSLLILPIACAHSQVPPALDRPLQAEFPAAWMDQLTFAYKDFRRLVKDPSCFNLRTYREIDSYIVDFVPAVGVKVDGDRIEIPIAGATSCGRGMRYEFDETGNFIRSVGRR